MYIAHVPVFMNITRGTMINMLDQTGTPSIDMSIVNLQANASSNMSGLWIRCLLLGNRGLHAYNGNPETTVMWSM